MTVPEKENKPKKQRQQRKQKDPKRLLQEYVVESLFGKPKKIRKTTAWVEAAKKYKEDKGVSYKEALQSLKKK